MVQCCVCDATLPALSSPDPASLQRRGEAIPATDNSGQLTGISAQGAEPFAFPPDAQLTTAVARPLGDLTGHVFAAEPAFMERPDFDGCRLTTRILWFMLLVASPVLIVHATLVNLGLLPAVLALLGFLFLLRFLSPSNLFSLFHLGTMLNPFRRTEAEQVPVRYYRIRADDESEVMVRIKGILTAGNLSMDDLVTFWGNWKRGTLMVQRAYNHRAMCWLDIEKSRSWIGLVATLLLIIALFTYFYEPTRVLLNRLQELHITP